MQKLDTSLLVLEFQSIALGYRLLSDVTENDNIRILEASACGPKFLVLALGPEKSLLEALGRTRKSIESTDPTQLLDHALIARVQQEVLDGVYALTQTQLQSQATSQGQNALLVAECDSVSGLLDLSQMLVTAQNMRIIELKIRRGSDGGAYGFFVGEKKSALTAAEEARVHLKDKVRKGRVEVIDSPNAEFRKFFDVTGPA